MDRVNGQGLGRREPAEMRGGKTEANGQLCAAARRRGGEEGDCAGGGSVGWLVGVQVGECAARWKSTRPPGLSLWREESVSTTDPSATSRHANRPKAPL